MSQKSLILKHFFEKNPNSAQKTLMPDSSLADGCITVGQTMRQIIVIFVIVFSCADALSEPQISVKTIGKQVAQGTVETSNFSSAFHNVKGVSSKSKSLSSKQLELLNKVKSSNVRAGGMMDLEKLLVRRKKRFGVGQRSPAALSSDIGTGVHSVFQTVNQYYDNKVRIDHRGEIAH